MIGPLRLAVHNFWVVHETGLICAINTRALASHLNIATQPTLKRVCSTSAGCMQASVPFLTCQRRRVDAEVDAHRGAPILLEQFLHAAGHGWQPRASPAALRHLRLRCCALRYAGRAAAALLMSQPRAVAATYRSTARAPAGRVNGCSCRTLRSPPTADKSLARCCGTLL